MTAWTTRFRAGCVGLVALCFAAGEVHAGLLDALGSPQWVEDFEGETAFPTTPEVDTLGFGGLEPVKEATNGQFDTAAVTLSSSSGVNTIGMKPSCARGRVSRAPRPASAGARRRPRLLPQRGPHLAGELRDLGGIEVGANGHATLFRKPRQDGAVSRRRARPAVPSSTSSAVPGSGTFPTSGMESRWTSQASPKPSGFVP